MVFPLVPFYSAVLKHLLFANVAHLFRGNQQTFTFYNTVTLYQCVSHFASILLHEQENLFKKIFMYELQILPSLFYTFHQKQIVMLAETYFTVT